MSLDPVVLALRAALASADSTQLRNALGEHLLKHGLPAEALAEFEAALLLKPSDREALQGAVRAAEAAGESGKLLAYRLALDSTGATPSFDKLAPVEAPARIPVAAHSLEGQPTKTESKPETAGIRLVADGGALLAEEVPSLSLADVGGMTDVKERIHRSFLLPLRNPALVQKFGKRMSGGLLLYGAPGCGKTFLARALAGEIGASFVNVALTDVLNLWHGESEKNLHEIFENARRQAPAVLFFDELDAIGQRRSYLKGSVGRTLANQMLADLDGFAARNEGVFVLGATNHPWDVDSALRRPGRFDRMIFIPPPDAPARAAIFQLKLKGRLASSGIDFARLVKATDGYSGADLEAIVETAVELAIEQSLKTNQEQPIDEAMLQKALKEVKASTRPWMETARNYAVYSNEGGAYDDLLAYLRSVGLG